ncbi:MAG: NAD(P)H-hydrate dehydratase [Syntrophobacterales bacterium]|jgi:NAD(P)H-hydrate epimerase|nr:NAD(P)H-hydrate dehydratase [Syntrophobacterales bacterium]
MKIATVEQMRAMDHFASEQLGIPEEILMENAGLAAASLLKDKIGITGKKFVILCGGGNNGGDGFVVARKIHSDGGLVKVFLLSDPDKYQGAAQKNYEMLAPLSISVQIIAEAGELYHDLAHCNAIVDAMLGTGLDRNVSGLYAAVIAMINRKGKTVFSLDIPSGINGNTGEIMGAAVQARYTITFGLPKIGNFLYPGFAMGGELYLSHISFPPSLYEQNELLIHVNDFVSLPPRDPDGYKGSMGDALIIAGSSAYMGAPFFAAMSFLKAGGGYARLAVSAGIAPFIAQKGSELVLLPQKETPAGTIAYANKEALFDQANKADCVIIGPGLSLHFETQQLICELAETIETPIIIDGDGLTAVAAKPDFLHRRQGKTILTPHLGEMSALTGQSIPAIRENRIAILQETSRNYNALIVLKGGHSLIGNPARQVYVNLSGNSGMATAGSGDVLTGIIGAMCSRKLSLEEGVRKGVFLHGLAGDLAAAALGEDGMTAQDILDFLPLALKQDRQGYEEKVWQKLYGGAEVV